MFRRNRTVQKIEPAVLDRYVELPVGTCLRTENGFYYINKINNKYVRFKIKTYRILNSWNFSYIVNSTESVFSKVQVVGFLGFRSGTVIKDISSGLYYIIEGSAKRQIEDPDYITSLGIKIEDVLLVSKEEVELHKNGEVIK